MSTPLFDDFWLASQLDRHNLAGFARRASAFDADHKQLRLDYPDAPALLPPTPATALERAARRRASRRAFGPGGLAVSDMAGLLASCRAWGGAEHRSYPSAGASYAVELFVVSWRVAGWGRRLSYYDAVDHGLVTLPDPAPGWDEAAPQINVSVSGEPAAMILAVIFADRLTAKYGERGGRFALLEAGAAMQQLSLSAAHLDVAGVVAGGLVDAYWLDLLGLRRAGGSLGFGYLVGPPAEPRTGFSAWWRRRR